MHLRSVHFTRRLLTIGAALLLPLGASQAFATGPTATGALTITATVSGSLAMSFTAGTGTSLTGSNTATATLAFGSLSAYGTTYPTNGVSLVSATGVTGCSACLVVSAPVNLVVMNSNVYSQGFNLTAYMTNTSDGNYWAVDSTAVTGSSSSPTPILTSGSGAYGSSGNALTIELGVPATANGGTLGSTLSVNNTINFTATAQ